TAMRTRQKVKFLPINWSVSARYCKQSSKHILQHASIIGERIAQLRCIALIPLGAITRLVEQAANVAHRLGRNPELTLERVDLLAPHRAITFGELGGQNDDAYREQLVTATE